MDDLVSRIISASMDLYFYYIPITLSNGRKGRAFNKFRVYAIRSDIVVRLSKVQSRIMKRKGISFILIRVSDQSAFVSLNVSPAYRRKFNKFES